MATAASEPPMVEQVITEFFAKSLHIILESRSPYESSRNFTRPSPPSSPLSGSQPRDRWFNLAPGLPGALENFDLWRQSNLEPLVIDIVLLHRNNTSTTSAGAGKIIERWVIQYEICKSGNGNDIGSKNNGRKPRNSSAVDHSLYRSTYQGSTVLLRSLYLVVRLLPAYNMFRELNLSGRICPLNLSHTISSFVEPFTRAEDAEMKRYAFSQIETLFGHLSLSVSYVPVLEVVAAPEPTTTMPMELIMDYIGSPATVFLKKFNSLPSAGIAPACVAMTRRHSWSIEHGPGPAVSPSPPMNSESHFRGLKLPRTSSKPFIMDELDEWELALAWEDRDTIIDQLNRADFSDREDQVTNQDAGGSLTRTPAAAVEALVRMLKTAPGLRESLPSIAAPLVPQEPSSVQRVVTEEHGNVTSSSAVVPSLLGSRTAADVLEELKKYKGIRESILNRGKTQPQDTELGERPTNGDP